MKTFAFVLLCLPLRASLVPLEWDASTTPDVSYAVFTSQEGSEPEWRVTVSTLAVNLGSLTPGKYDVYVTAVLNGVHSAPSNTIVVEVPEPPTGPVERFRVEGSSDLIEWEVTGNIIEADLTERRKFYRLLWASPP